MKAHHNASTAPRPLWQYCKATLEESAFLLQLTALADFIRLAEMQSAKVVFLLEEEASGAPVHFAIAYNGGLLRQAADGFKTLEDYTAARQAGFSEALDYYAAIAAGYRQYADYRLALDTGVAESGTIAEMKEGGFIEGFIQWQTLSAKDSGNASAFAEIAPVANAYDLYQKAKAAHFENWSAMQTALEAGFLDNHEYEAARAKGFENAAVYNAALSRGFISMEEYKSAEKHKLRDARDAQAFSDLMLTTDGLITTSAEQRVLFILLSRLEQGKRASANKLWEQLLKMSDAYRYEDTGEMPLWFNRSFESREDMVSFLDGNDDLKVYGIYDRDGEFFESKHLRDREVVIDGSNVAYNSIHKKDHKPRVANMLLMVRFLKSKGFERVSIISDAALWHKLEDREDLEILRQEAEYIEAPAEKPADVFIIQHVRNSHCLLVSNDTFREWKTQIPWVAENIDYYRLTFLIRGEEVIMPDVI